ncbi:MAG: hypothetical protein IJX15_05240 [Ruminiclostridium sp.]|nr:hypothetical protein [Ruminiclostridium sp.]MBQ8411118.1 hypothetical protein [Ruminiclostridium sp.]MBQ8842701.1 hypothetical protein [Ruminiclostridium sp.]
MEAFANIISASLVAIFVQNSIFERALGINVLLYASRKRENLLGFFIAITYVTTISSAIIWNFDRLFAQNEYYYIFMPILYVAVVSIVYVVSLIVIWRFFPKLFKALKKYVHLSVFNCSVIGALFLSSQQGESIFSYIGYGFGTGIGFLLAAYLLYIAVKRLNSPLVPAAFRGFPVMIVYVGILSLALYAFAGYSTAAM